MRSLFRYFIEGPARLDGRTAFEAVHRADTEGPAHRSRLIDIQMPDWTAMKRLETYAPEALQPQSSHLRHRA